MTRLADEIDPIEAGHCEVGALRLEPEPALPASNPSVRHGVEGWVFVFQSLLA